MGKKEQMSALGLDYAKGVAEHWPDLPHAHGVVEFLPSSIPQMLAEQSDEFLLGWFNAVAMVHDLGVKVLTSELVKRTGGVASDERDVLLTRVGAAVEGLSYMACVEAVSRRSDPDEKEDQGD